jgi:hypothetical protein
MRYTSLVQIVFFKKSEKSSDKSKPIKKAIVLYTQQLYTY